MTMAYSKERYAQRKAEHLCTRCGQQDEDTLAGKTRCSVCTEKQNARRAKARMDAEKGERCRVRERERNKRLTEEHRCLSCGRPLPEDHQHVRCPECLVKQRLVASKYRQSGEINLTELRKRNHLCVRCGKQDAYTLVGRSSCHECAERDRLRRRSTAQRTADAERKKQRYHTRVEQHLCTICGKPLDPQNTYLVCPHCMARRREISRRYRVRHGVVPREYYPDGSCVRCGKFPRLDGKELCQRCYDVAISNLSKAWGTPSENHPWRIDEQIRHARYQHESTT